MDEERVMRYGMEYQDKIQVGIFTLILGFFLLLLIKTVELPSPARQVPLFILALVIPITIVRIILLFKPGVASSVRIQSFTPEDAITAEEGNEEEESPLLKPTVIVILWFMAFAVAIYLAGFTPGTFLFILAFLYLRADFSLPRSFIAATLLAAFVYVVFIIGMNIRQINPILFP